MEKSWADTLTMFAAWAAFFLSVHQFTAARSLERVSRRHDFIVNMLALRQQLRTLMEDAKECASELKLLPLPIGNNPRVIIASNAAFDISINAKKHAKQFDEWQHKLLYTQPAAGSAVEFKTLETQLTAMRSTADELKTKIDGLNALRAKLA